MADVLYFIETIRNSFIGADTVYTKGSCYQFFLILKCVFPQADAYYDSDHVITKIDDLYYDINGVVEIGRHLKMDEHYPESSVKNCKYDITFLATRLLIP